eukprot:CAMPEP_0202860832 /NCGR_PEP_ID=MMETSP1391-20130828/2420_1 /ASSEMBLY_ACC=CAM_ASM_000867 /TAXON_ID=1034604 /ORGANISM="Chlamydomonas leiostraca, Strain SAG 11-49" /LENGTH=41 /DNA_ID= /DNA_START= /DNA_END= /DNA_ORIENTATION=
MPSATHPVPLLCYAGGLAAVAVAAAAAAAAGCNYTQGATAA